MSRPVSALLAVLLAATPGPAAPEDQPMDDPDLAAARIAWRYFERNTHPATGLVSSVEGYPSTSAWDLGSSILAALAARELGLLARQELEARVSAILRTLETAPLFAGELPNKAYDAATARMTDYRNAPAPDGIGFSAVDLGRLVTALALAGDLHPSLRPGIERALSRWNTCRLARGGELFGVHRDRDGRLRHLQEGRLGYEQYAAKGLALLGLDTAAARSYGRHLAEFPLLGVSVPHDDRDRARFGAVDAVVTDPWALGALELGLEVGGAPLAQRVFEVQKRRFAATGVVTARSEDHVDRPPWFVYGAILADGVPWRTVDPEGNEVGGLAAVSTKAAFALAALHPGDPYGAVLRRAVEGARDPDRGWFAGVYEGGGPNRALTANTNAVVLEAIVFRRRGPLRTACGACEGRAEWRVRLASLASRNARCPAEDAGAAGPGGGDLAARALAPTPGATPAGGAAPPRAGGGPRVDGAIFLTYRSEGGGAGGIATVWPWRSAFLRLGAEATPPALAVSERSAADRGNARLLWGFGWDDWHGNTLSLTVHNWGPVRPDEAPNWSGAEANLGYKLPRLCAAPLCIGSIAAVTVPFNGGPYADFRVTFTLWEKWFVMGGVGRVFPADVFPSPSGVPRWRVVYGFGRWDWHPGTFYLTYYDWGPNEQARNGVLSLGVNWRF